MLRTTLLCIPASAFLRNLTSDETSECAITHAEPTIITLPAASGTRKTGIKTTQVITITNVDFSKYGADETIPGGYADITDIPRYFQQNAELALREARFLYAFYTNTGKNGLAPEQTTAHNVMWRNEVNNDVVATANINDNTVVKTDRGWTKLISKDGLVKFMGNSIKRSGTRSELRQVSHMKSSILREDDYEMRDMKAIAFDESTGEITLTMHFHRLSSDMQIVESGEEDALTLWKMRNQLLLWQLVRVMGCQY